MSEVWQRNLAVPYFTQRDNTYIWQQKYKEDKIDAVTGKKTEIKDQPFGPKYPMSWRTCNITSLCMILHYYGITNKTPEEMIEEVFSNKEWRWQYETTVEEDEAKKKGISVAGAASLESWDRLKKVAEYYMKEKFPEYTVYTGKELTKELLQEQISKGNPVMISTGLGSPLENAVYKRGGHIVVVRGFTDDGYVIINDPWGMPVDSDGNVQSGDKPVTGYYNYSTYANIGDNVLVSESTFDKVYAVGETKCLYIEGPLWNFPTAKDDKPESLYKPYNQEDIKTVYKQEEDYSNCYPIKANNLWHNGVHLTDPNGFYSIGCGRLIAARNSEVVENGSNSFALIKYQLPNKDNEFFYALYMHLKKIDLKKELEYFFLDKEGKFTVSNNIKGTWYEQIFNNLLPMYRIYFYSEKKIDFLERKIYKADFKNGKLTATTQEIQLDPSNKGYESRHMKIYLLPPDKLDKLADIENYKSLTNLKFMLKPSGKIFKTSFVKDGYLFFVCGTADSRKLCCTKMTGNSLIESYTHINEVNYKYYANKLYELYEGKVVQFKKIGTNIKTSSSEEESDTYTVKDSILAGNIRYDEKYLYKICISNNEKVKYIDSIFDDLYQDNKKFFSYIEHLFVLYSESRDFKFKSIYDECIKNFSTKRKEQLNNILYKIDEEVEIKNTSFKYIDNWMKSGFKKSDTEWLQNIIKIITKYIKDTNNIDFTFKCLEKETLSSVRDALKVDINQLAIQNTSLALTVCEYISLHLVSLPDQYITNGRFRYSKDTNVKNSTTIKQIISFIETLLNEFDSFYKNFFEKRYIDNYIEIPKGAKIGKGSVLPDSGEADSIHFEIFSINNILPENKEIEHTDNDSYFDDNKISEKLLSVLDADTKKKYVKYFTDGVILKNDIKNIYKETNIFKELVTYHKSEWAFDHHWNANKLRFFLKTKPDKIKKEIKSTEEYYKDIYEKYSWYDKKLLDSGKDYYYFYHPLYFLTKI